MPVQGGCLKMGSPVAYEPASEAHFSIVKKVFSADAVQASQDKNALALPPMKPIAVRSQIGAKPLACSG